MDKEKVQRRVFKGGKPLDLDLFTWDSSSRTFSSEENDLVIYFEGKFDYTFETGSNCEFVTGGECVFTTGSHCIFNTGCNCMFTTGPHCIFDVGFDCVFYEFKTESHVSNHVFRRVFLIIALALILLFIFIVFVK